MNAYDLRRCIETENLLWLCNDCLLLFRKQYSTDENAKSTTDERIDESSIEITVGQLQQDIEEIKKGFSVLKECVDRNRMTHQMPSASTPQGSNSRMSIPSMNYSNVTDTRLLMGSNAENTTLNSSRKFWIYFTRIAKHVTNDEMRQMVSHALKLDDPPDVVKLVPAWKRLDDLHYVSFKVGVDQKHKDEAILESTWPAGLMFREFICQEPCLWEP